MTDRDYEFSAYQGEPRLERSSFFDELNKVEEEALLIKKFAFPFTIDAGSGKTITHYGMSLHEWYAGQALSGILAGYWGSSSGQRMSHQAIALAAKQYADAMMEVLK